MENVNETRFQPDQMKFKSFDKNCGTTALIIILLRQLSTIVDNIPKTILNIVASFVQEFVMDSAKIKQ